MIFSGGAQTLLIYCITIMCISFVTKGHIIKHFMYKSEIGVINRSNVFFGLLCSIASLFGGEFSQRKK
jgi:hypothetical protein